MARYIAAKATLTPLLEMTGKIPARLERVRSSALAAIGRAYARLGDYEHALSASEGTLDMDRLTVLSTVLSHRSGALATSEPPSSSQD